MANIGNGYGSECHLLRYLGRHRHRLDDEICKVIGANHIDWLDFHFDPSRPGWSDGERKGLDFIDPELPIHREWSRFWPQTGSAMNWDAVGRAGFHGCTEWLLVEAKANIEELESSCQAKDRRSIETIRKAIEDTKRELGVPPERDWLAEYYQFCNRIAALNFLVHNSQPAHLLFIYFTGDDGIGRRTCPKREARWESALRKQQEHTGLPSAHPLVTRIHKLFLPVCPRRA